MVGLVQMYPATVGLMVLGLALYGSLHGRLIVHLWRGHEQSLVLWLLLTSPFGVGVPILTLALAAGQQTMTGWEAAIATVALEGVAFLPLALVVGGDPAGGTRSEGGATGFQMASNYVGKVGGSNWAMLVKAQQQRNREVIKTIERLEGAAASDATRLLLSQAKCEVLKNQAELVEMLLIAKTVEPGRVDARSPARRQRELTKGRIARMETGIKQNEQDYLTPTLSKGESYLTPTLSKGESYLTPTLSKGESYLTPTLSKGEGDCGTAARLKRLAATYMRQAAHHDRAVRAWAEGLTALVWALGRVEGALCADWRRRKWPRGNGLCRRRHHASDCPVAGRVGAGGGCVGQRGRAGDWRISGCDAGRLCRAAHGSTHGLSPSGYGAHLQRLGIRQHPRCGDTGGTGRYCLDGCAGDAFVAGDAGGCVWCGGRTSVDFSAGRAGAQRGGVGGALVGARGGAMPHYRVTGYIRIDDEDMSGRPVFSDDIDLIVEAGVQRRG